MLWWFGEACSCSDFRGSPVAMLLKNSLSSACDLLRGFTALCVHVDPLGFNDVLNAHERCFCWISSSDRFLLGHQKRVRAPEGPQGRQSERAGRPLPSMHLGVMKWTDGRSLCRNDVRFSFSSHAACSVFRFIVLGTNLLIKFFTRSLSFTQSLIYQFT